MNHKIQTAPLSGLPTNGLNMGSVAIEAQRAVAEAQARVMIARACPRDEQAAIEAIRRACSNKAFAKKALYSYRRGKDTITGPSIRLAEELVRLWQNMEYGIVELSRRKDATELRAFAWDIQANVMSSHNFVVSHKRDTSDGGRDLTAERDIYENNANMAARRMRARILAVLPPEYVQLAVDECLRVQAEAASGEASGGPSPAQIAGMLAKFERVQVTRAELERFYGRKMEDFDPDTWADAWRLHTALRDEATSKHKVFPWLADSQSPSDALAKDFGDDKEESQ